MKLAIILLLSFLGHSVVKNTDSGQTTLSIFRVGKLTGGAVNYSITVDGQEVCKLSTNKYIKIALTPGEHVVVSKASGAGYLSNPERVLRVKAEAGKDNFVKATARMKGLAGFLELTEVSSQEGETLASKVKKFDHCQQNK